MALAFVGCAEEAPEPSPNPTAPVEAATVHRDSVPLTFEASLGGGATRAEFKYESSALKLSWSEKDALGVYIKTEDGKILRAGSIFGTGDITNSGKTRKFSGYVLQKFDGEEYIYMHPDIGSQTYVNLEEMEGELNSTAHLNEHLPIVWWEKVTKGTYLGYVLRLTLNFQTTNPGRLKKVTLLTDRRNVDAKVYGDRIFPRHYNINNLALGGSVFPFNASNTGSIVEGYDTDNADYTHAITLNVKGDGTVHKIGDNYTADVYLTSSEVQNLNILSSKIKVSAVNENNTIYSSSVSVSFYGQNGKTSYSSDELLKNGTLKKMAAIMQEGNLSTTIINEKYKVTSILGMWNEYGRPYDPNGLMVYEGGDAELPAKGSGIMPDQLIDNISALRTRSLQSLTGTATSGTPTYTWVLYESQCTGYQNNHMILRETGPESAQTDHGADHSQSGTTINNIEIISPTKVYFTFLGEYAWWQNLIGYYHYNKNQSVASSDDVTKVIIFPNASKPGHEPFNSFGASVNNIGKAEDAPLKLGETVKLLYTNPDGTVSEEFPADEVIGFFLMQNPQANGFHKSDFNLMNWLVPKYFSNQAWNASANTGWPTTGRLNTFVSADVCNVTNPATNYKAPSSTKVKGMAFYGAMDDISKRGQNTAWSAMLFAISTSNPEAMKTQNRMYFNIGTGNTVVLKENVTD